MIRRLKKTCSRAYSFQVRSRRILSIEWSETTNLDDCEGRVSVRAGHLYLHITGVYSADTECMMIRRTWRRPLAFLLSVSNASRLGLHFAHLTKVHTHSPCPEGVRLRLPAILLERSSQSADKRVERPPRLSKRAWTRVRRLRKAVVGTRGQMHLSLAELVQVSYKVEDMCAGTSCKRQRRSMVAQVLAERVPVSPLLSFVAARCPGRFLVLRRRQVIMAECYNTTTAMNGLPSLHHRSSCPMIDQ